MERSLKTDIIIAFIFFVAGALISYYFSETYAELSVVGTMGGDTLTIEIKNTANFKETGSITIWGISEGKDIIVGNSKSIKPKQSRILPIKLNLTKTVITKNETYQKDPTFMYYQITCDNCRPQLLKTFVYRLLFGTGAPNPDYELDYAWIPLKNVK
jgi:hypothetical protein